jgi:hypothetical protein
MTAADRKLVDRYLPWTRVVADVPATYHGVTRGLPELLIADKDAFLLKGAISMKGEDVLMGRDTDDATWESAVQEAVARGDSIAQERVESLRYPMSVRHDDGEVGSGLVAPILGPFVIGGEPAGCLARYFTNGDDSVVSVERHGASQNLAVAVD